MPETLHTRAAAPPVPTRAPAPVAHLPVVCPAACQNEPLLLRLRINGPLEAGAARLAEALLNKHLP